MLGTVTTFVGDKAQAPRIAAVAAARLVGRVILTGEYAAASPLPVTLARAGFDVVICATAYETLSVTQAGEIDLVAMIGDPADKTAHELTRALRNSSELAILLVSDHGTLSDRILGLELGADDYVSSSMEPLELLARIRTILRRMRRPQTSPAGSKFLFNGWSLDTRTRTLLDATGRDVHLAAREFEVLELLLKRANQVVPRGDLQGSSPASHDSRAIDALIGRVRRKIGDDARSRVIRPVRNSGYVLTLAVEVSAA